MADTEAEIEKRLIEEENNFVDREIEKARQAARARGVDPRIYLFSLLTETVTFAYACNDLEWLELAYREMVARLQERQEG